MPDRWIGAEAKDFTNSIVGCLSQCAVNEAQNRPESSDRNAPAAARPIDTQVGRQASEHSDGIELELSKQKAADSLGITWTEVDMIENAERTVSTLELAKIADLFEVSISQFFDVTPAGRPLNENAV